MLILDEICLFPEYIFPEENMTLIFLAIHYKAYIHELFYLILLHEHILFMALGINIGMTDGLVHKIFYISFKKPEHFVLDPGRVGFR